VYHFGDANSQWAQRMPGACAITRERHVGQMAAGIRSPLQVSIECSDGSGHVLMKKLQAEPDPASTATPPPLRWVVNGLAVLNNKGKPVKQYEPAFSAVGFGCEAPQANGVATVMYYDAIGRLVRTEMPDGTFSRVDLSPWEVRKYDQNDTVSESQWYADRAPGTAAASEDKRAAALALKHNNTPVLTILDSLGRDVLTIAHNRTPDDAAAFAAVPLVNRPWLDERYATFSRLDAEGKPLWIRDARGHLVMQYISPPRRHGDPRDTLPSDAAPCYDIAGNLLYQHSMDGGDRWMLMDAAGKPMLAWDVNDRRLDDGSVVTERRLFRTRYDALHRPVEQWLRVNADAPALIEAFEYADTATFTSSAGVVDQVALADARSRNLIGQAVRHYDSSGLATIERVDFKGAAEEITRTLVRSVGAAVVDWNVADRSTLLEQETFRRVEERDALGRMTTLYNWHSGLGGRVAVYLPSYNGRGSLRSEELVVGTTRMPGGFDPNAGTRTPAIREIRYNAKGQKTSVAHGNGTTTTYTYDSNTFRLTRLETSDTRALQDLHYTYDPAGNITHIQDDAQQTVWFANQQIEPSSDYVYDALYRLIESTGRENRAAVGAPPQPEGPWVSGTFASGADTRRYTQRVAYDGVGNILAIRHISPGFPGQPDGGWTRVYAYAFDDVTQPASNRLWQTWQGGNRAQAVTYRHDSHGSLGNLEMTAPGVDIRWDWRDMIRALDLLGGGDAFYSYGSDKQRARKRIVRGDGSSEDRMYFGGFELYRRRDPQGAVVEQIESLHLMDGDQRVLLVEDVQVASPAAGPDGLRVRKQTLFRYQYGNHLGSVTLELDEAARVISYEEFHPYGTTSFRLMNAAVEAPAKRYRYTGMERDGESGLNYHGARYYAAWLGRWVSTDPASVTGGVNVYGYADADPVRLKDANGQFPTAAESATKWEHSWLSKVNPIVPGFRGEDYTRQADSLMNAVINPVMDNLPSGNGFFAEGVRNNAVMYATGLKTVGTAVASVVAGALDPLSVVRGIMHLGEGAAAGVENIEKGNTALGVSQVVGDVSQAVLVATPAIKTSIGVARLGGEIADLAGKGFTEGAKQVVGDTAPAAPKVITPPPLRPGMPLVEGKPVPPTGRATLYTGKSSTKIPDPAVIGKGGFKTSGTNLDLAEHKAGATDSAWQGATEQIMTPDKESGAARFAADSAGESGWVFKIVGVEFWDVNQLLFGRAKSSPFLSAAFNEVAYASEAELTISGNIPGSMIEGWYPVSNVEGQIRVGQFVENPNFVRR